MTAADENLGCDWMPAQLRLIINNGPTEPVVIDLLETQELLDFRAECDRMTALARQLAVDTKAVEQRFYRLVQTYANESGYVLDHPLRDQFLNAMMELCDWNTFGKELGI